MRFIVPVTFVVGANKKKEGREPLQPRSDGQAPQHPHPTKHMDIFEGGAESQDETNTGCAAPLHRRTAKGTPTPATRPAQMPQAPCKQQRAPGAAKTVQGGSSRQQRAALRMRASGIPAAPIAAVPPRPTPGPGATSLKRCSSGLPSRYGFAVVLLLPPPTFTSFNASD
ncbi:hypothetical protein NDU88_009901 [Pleurodeles waltl]|uniref:Uncharacterized protein n=1 Tax=Pleurodeles waltl TaxID=8319 RepID=A0AAV7RXF9_PLEWA|nr:hypothetical protein NDU88_009901 [Pleurodeles waltl]